MQPSLKKKFQRKHILKFCFFLSFRLYFYFFCNFRKNISTTTYYELFAFFCVSEGQRENKIWYFVFTDEKKYKIFFWARTNYDCFVFATIFIFCARKRNSKTGDKWPFLVFFPCLENLQFQNFFFIYSGCAHQVRTLEK